MLDLNRGPISDPIQYYIIYLNDNDDDDDQV